MGESNPFRQCYIGVKCVSVDLVIFSGQVAGVKRSKPVVCMGQTPKTLPMMQPIDFFLLKLKSLLRFYKVPSTATEKLFNKNGEK